VTDLDPRLVELYDEDNPDGPDHDHYRALADRSGARSVIDLGCGTGILTVTLAVPGREVVGVDPSATMLDRARGRPGSAAVTWIHGDSRRVPGAAADLAVMTGNVAQHIGDEEWTRTLRDLRRALRVGGTLAFESRNPTAQAWRGWATPGRTVRDTRHGPLEEWNTVDVVAPGSVRLIASNRFTATDETIVVTQVLRFRSRVELERQLDAAGFTVTAVAGDWHGGPVSDASAVLVFTAVAR